MTDTTTGPATNYSVIDGFGIYYAGTWEKAVEIALADSTTPATIFTVGKSVAHKPANSTEIHLIGEVAA